MTRKGRTVVVILFLLAALAAWAGIDAYQIWTYPAADGETADAAIVLGASTWRGEPSPAFKARIDHGINLYRRGQVKRLIFTGGRGAGESVSNAEAARTYALRLGIPEANIRVEMQSRYTRENIAYAKAAAVDEGIRTFLIVSDPLHMRRAMQMARDQGLQAHPAATPMTRYTSLKSRLWFLRRETYFLMQYQFVTRFLRIPERGEHAADHDEGNA